ncbi:MAG: hypothetical protein Kow0065_15630 [Methylomicrobium sp.]
MAVPVIMTLSSKTVLGGSYHCTISGQQSGNLSSHPDVPNCGVGFSPGGWRQNAYKAGDQDGNISYWLGAEVIPFDIIYKNEVTFFNSKKDTPNKRSKANTYPNDENDKKCVVYYDTKDGFKTVCGDETMPIGNSKAWEIYDKINNSNLGAKATKFNEIFGGTDGRTLHQVLEMESGGLTFHAIAAYLNAALYHNTGFNLFYPAYESLTPAYIVSVYNDPNYSDELKQDFFESIIH